MAEQQWTALGKRRLGRRALLGTSAKAGVGAAGLALVGCAGDVILEPSDAQLDARIDAAVGDVALASPTIGLSLGFDARDPAQTIRAPLLPPPAVPAPITRTQPARVVVDLETVEEIGRLADGVEYNFWSFAGTVPGPLVRVRAGDIVQINLANRAGNSAPHNIDLHAVNGPGGGAGVTTVNPGESASFEFKALVPGLYVYHCAVAPVAAHISNGMYGMILVEPEEGLPPVDKEFYVVQGEFYPTGARGTTGLRGLDLEKLLDERPEFVTFNGSADALIGEGALRANVGDTVRIYFGVGGPNLISSFHVIGEIFDLVYDKGSFAAPMRNVQTTAVLPGGATIVEFTIQVPGTYLLVDHALSRALKGAAGHLVASGPENPSIFKPLLAAIANDEAGTPSVLDTDQHEDASEEATDVHVDRTINVVMTEFAYEPAEIVVALGETVRLVLTNEGGVLHDITSDGFHGVLHTAEGTDHDHAQPDGGFHAAAEVGLQAELIFTAEEVGEFDLFCSVPGHRDLGMTAVLLVTA
jgi:nitrite reductase (NO-forming)